VAIETGGKNATLISFTSKKEFESSIDSWA